MASPTTVENSGNDAPSSLSSRRRLERLLPGRHAAPGEEAELLGDGAGVGEALSLRERPGGHVEVLADARGSRRRASGGTARRSRPPAPAAAAARCTRLRTSVSRSRKAGLVLGQQLPERAGQTLERAVVLVRVPAGRARPWTSVSSARRSSENWSAVSPDWSSPTTSSASRPKSFSRSSERSKYGQLRSSVVWKPSTSSSALRNVWKYSPMVSASAARTPCRPSTASSSGRYLSGMTTSCAVFARLARSASESKGSGEVFTTVMIPRRAPPPPPRAERPLPSPSERGSPGRIATGPQ